VGPAGLLPAQSRDPRPSRPGGILGVPYPETAAEYEFPITRPARVLQGNHSSYSHQDPYNRYAWDFGAPVGTPVAAVRGGVVAYSRDESAIGGSDRERYYNEANTITIDHLDGTRACYLHLHPGGNRVRVGEYVIAGEIIGMSGDTGWCGTPHLHYTLLDARTQESMASCFRAWNQNDGVPVEGDTVPGAPPPAVPQSIIDALKRRWRASREAERRGLLDLAFDFAVTAARPAAPPDYLYTRVLAAWSEKLAPRVAARLKTLTAIASPTGEQIVEAQRWLVVWPRGRTELAAERSALAQAVRKWPRPARYWGGEIGAMKLWIEGLRHECREDRLKALVAYRAALKRSGRRFRPTVLAALKRIIRFHGRACTRRFNRLDHEAALAGPAHADRIRSGAQRALDEWRVLARAWIAHRPEERARARAALDEARERYAAILKHLGDPR